MWKPLKKTSELSTHVNWFGKPPAFPDPKKHSQKPKPTWEACWSSTFCKVVKLYHIYSFPETSIFRPWKGWLEDEPFLLRFGLFSAMLVLRRGFLDSPCVWFFSIGQVKNNWAVKNYLSSWLLGSWVIEQLVLPFILLGIKPHMKWESHQL